ncbi:ion channel [Bacillus sp. 03113]|uniref:ion channel n=1 Tax=Bacillus sp. 03113 TaxID=2578211 RepID=UPI001143FE58|nr:ion channel [Bacillus sp. 03113]
MSVYFAIAVVSVCMLMSLRTLFLPYNIKGKWVSYEYFLSLAFIYLTLLIGFSLIYTLLEINGFVVLDDGLGVGRTFLNRFMRGLYFSGMTLFSVGYGEIVPVGIGRVLALIEAFFGFAIPAVFVTKTFMEVEKE